MARYARHAPRPPERPGAGRDRGMGWGRGRGAVPGAGGWVMVAWQVLEGDCRATLAALPPGVVQTVVTSPPYWRLRCYSAGDPRELGQEPTPAAYVAALAALAPLLRRVLRPDGTLWLLLGDRYWRKQLLLLPAAVAEAFRAQGWVVRAELPWRKAGGLPERVADRPTRCHETVLLLAPRARYYYDAAAGREPARDWGVRDRRRTRYAQPDPTRPFAPHRGLGRANFAARGRNRRGWFDGPPAQAKGGDHPATMPLWLARALIPLTSRPGDLVLDPFCGSGTTGVAALQLGRRFVGCELVPRYAALARARLAAEAPLLQPLLAAGGGGAGA